MKKIPSLAVPFVCLFIAVIVMSELQIVDGYSETFTRSIYASGGTRAFYFCKLQAGDRIAGTFTLSNLGPYTATFPEEPNHILSYNVYYRMNISFGLKGEEAMPARTLIFTDTKGDSFSYTAPKSADFWITCQGASRYALIDAKDPVITINYDIIKAQTPIPITPAPTEQPTASPTTQPTSSPTTRPESTSMLFSIGIGALIVLAVTATTIAVLNTRKH